MHVISDFSSLTLKMGSRNHSGGHHSSHSCAPNSAAFTLRAHCVSPSPTLLWEFLLRLKAYTRQHARNLQNPTCYRIQFSRKQLIIRLISDKMSVHDQSDFIRPVSDKLQLRRIPTARDDNGSMGHGSWVKWVAIS